MRRTLLAAAATVALLATTASAAVAFPESKAYGKGVQVHCTAYENFGQYVEASKGVAGHRPVKGGAKAFITFMVDPANADVAEAHGCFQ